MAGFIHLTILFSFIKVIVSDECIINNRTPENTYEEQLHDHLRCNYDYYIRPYVNGTDNATVSVQFMLKYFTFDSYTEEFSIQTWIHMAWSDDRLKWNPEDYKGIHEIVSSYVWMPRLRLFRSDEEDHMYYTRDPCQVKSSGIVVCVTKRHHYVRCRTNMADWPYDAQKCNMEFGPWVKKGEYVSLTFGPRAITMMGADYGAEWVITDYEQKTDPNSERQLRMTFTLERESGVMAAIIVYPSVLISIFTVLCLFLDVRNNIRLALIGFSLVVQFERLTDVGRDMPVHSADPPTILMFLRGSLTLTVLSGFLTLFLCHLCKKTSTPYQWIAQVNGFVLNSYGWILVWPQWEVKEDITISEDIKFTAEWSKFACVLNRVSTVVIIITYVCLYLKFMPQPIPFA